LIPKISEAIVSSMDKIFSSLFMAILLEVAYRRVVAAPDKVVEGYVEVVGEGDESIDIRFYCSGFIPLVITSSYFK